MLNPRFDSMFSKRGECFLNLDKLKACIRDCSRAIEINSDNADAFKSRGRAYKQLGRIEEAFKDLSACDMILEEEDYQWTRWIKDHKQERQKRRDEYQKRLAI